jgi:uncharacterized protein (TIGR03435 family)
MTYARFDERSRATFSNNSMSEFARFLGDRLGKDRVFGAGGRSWVEPAAVLDKTGLTGRYDFTLDFAAFPSAVGDPSTISAIKGAIVKQLGLKLIEAKVPTGTLVIDHVEVTPTDN